MEVGEDPFLLLQREAEKVKGYSFKSQQDTATVCIITVVQNVTQAITYKALVAHSTLYEEHIQNSYIIFRGRQTFQEQHRVNADIYFVDKLLYFALKAPPLELHGDEFVRTHSWSICFCTELCL